ncbi:hypothetical protein T492DRAFT_76310 [Pavlovales sp. CCMP2436]|nr:hypothetical protein T492DRAFT_76310 [Pavlovales sp. CCMP2436]
MSLLSADGAPLKGALPLQPEPDDQAEDELWSVPSESSGDFSAGVDGSAALPQAPHGCVAPLAVTGSNGAAEPFSVYSISAPGRGAGVGKGALQREGDSGIYGTHNIDVSKSIEAVRSILGKGAWKRTDVDLVGRLVREAQELERLANVESLKKESAAVLRAMGTSASRLLLDSADAAAGAKVPAELVAMEMVTEVSEATPVFEGNRMSPEQRLALEYEALPVRVSRRKKQPQPVAPKVDAHMSRILQDLEDFDASSDDDALSAGVCAGFRQSSSFSPEKVKKKKKKNDDDNDDDELPYTYKRHRRVGW